MLDTTEPMTDESLFSLLLHHLGHLAAALPCGTRRQIHTRLAKAVDVCSISEDDRRGPGPGPSEEIPIDLELLQHSLRVIYPGCGSNRYCVPHRIIALLYLFVQFMCLGMV